MRMPFAQSMEMATQSPSKCVVLWGALWVVLCMHEDALCSEYGNGNTVPLKMWDGNNTRAS